MPGVDGGAIAGAPPRAGVKVAGLVLGGGVVASDKPSSSLCTAPPPTLDAKLPTELTDASSSSTAAICLSQCEVSVSFNRMRPLQQAELDRSLDLSGVAYELKSTDAVPSLRSWPSGVSSRSEKEADFGLKAPLFAFLNMVQMSARSWLVLAVRESDPSTEDNVSLTTKGSVVVRRGQRLPHKRASFPAACRPHADKDVRGSRTSSGVCRRACAVRRRVAWCECVV